MYDRKRNFEGAAAIDSSPLSGYTHNFYKYPTRFSPKFVRTAIEIFTRPGDFVFNPLVGGGTSLVDSLFRNSK